jgi:hypothetical protein
VFYGTQVDCGRRVSPGRANTSVSTHKELRKLEKEANSGRDEWQRSEQQIDIKSKRTWRFEAKGVTQKRGRRTRGFEVVRGKRKRGRSKCGNAGLAVFQHRAIQKLSWSCQEGE